MYDTYSNGIEERSGWTRREMLRGAACGLLGFSLNQWAYRMADALAANGERRRQCILLWMTGGPSQLDTFDMKPGHANGGEFQEIQTSVPGLRWSEHLPKLAQLAEHLAIVRGMSTKEGDHGRGTYLMRTGHQPGGPIQYPTLGSLVSKELGDSEAKLPNYISIAPVPFFNQNAFQPGFLGPRHAPLTVGSVQAYQQTVQQQPGGFANLGVDDLKPPLGRLSPSQLDNRLELLIDIQKNYSTRNQAPSAVAHKTIYERTIRMMYDEATESFDLSQEPENVREMYGRGVFGQGCLMARRLIERGVPFVDVTLSNTGNGAFGWDTHANNFNFVKDLSSVLDAGWSSLLIDLKERGLLETTTILWMGEFGRTPQINNNGGRDHYPKAWTTVLAGGGIKGGQAHGNTSADGTTVEHGQVDVGDLLATYCQAAGINPKSQNISEIGRPISLAEGTPIQEILS